MPEWADVMYWSKRRELLCKPASYEWKHHQFILRQIECTQSIYCLQLDCSRNPILALNHPFVFGRSACHSQAHAESERCRMQSCLLGLCHGSFYSDWGHYRSCKNRSSREVNELGSSGRGIARFLRKGLESGCLASLEASERCFEGVTGDCVLHGKV